jgi:hypothetical protein
LAGWYDNPIPFQFLAPIDGLKIPALPSKKENPDLGFLKEKVFLYNGNSLSPYD